MSSQIIFTDEMASNTFPIGPYNLPWPIPSYVDDGCQWRDTTNYDERMKKISQSTLDWHHEEWMQVLP